MQTDNDIRLQLGIINGESLKLQFEVSPMGWMHPGVPPNWNSRLLLMRDFPVLSLDVRHRNLVMYVWAVTFLSCFYLSSFNDCILKLSQIILYYILKLYICV